ncbi:two-component system response regulator RstA [Tolumonas lignilytica]|uniref:two-component system response regulator RstA n=1 Tax=Tolumonas lignilytica TaxID=1283284 RepID=UPI0004674130|nr:two-component system response regulator RstA [Tolumonas lignilytica]
MQRIVFVEDDAELGALIKGFLGKHDLEVTLVPRGDIAMDIILQEKPDLVLLDIMLPGIDGLTLCRNLRPHYSGPIVMLTSLDSDMNQILGLELGASDYILKTTPPAVLLARLRVQLRQQPVQPVQTTQATPAATGHPLHFGQLTIDPVSRDVVLADEVIQLSTSDFDLLWELASHAGHIMSRDSLLKVLRGVEYDGLDRSVDVAISRLRRKLGDNAQEPTRIKTVRNKGYLLAPAAWN